MQHGGGASAPAGPEWHPSSIYALIPLLPLLGCVLAGLCAALRVKSKLPAGLSVGSLAVSFVLTVMLFMDVSGTSPHRSGTLHVFDWISFRWGDDSADHVRSFTAN